MSKYFECQRRNNEILWSYLLSKKSINEFVKSQNPKRNKPDMNKIIKKI